MIRPNVNWHSALVSGLKIELSSYNDILTFSPEYVLNAGPRRIDCLIEKKRGSPPIDLPLASEFRRYNLIDYKSPHESMTVTNFYKVLSYALSLPEYLKDSSVIENLSVMLITHKYPRKLMKYLTKKTGKDLKNSFPGIYDISIDIVPIRILVLPQLRAEDYLWLRCLTDHLDQNVPLRKLEQAYLPHKEEVEYQNFMNQFIRANCITEEDRLIMCEALYELFADEMVKCEQRGEKRGRKQGRKQGEQRVAALIKTLILDNRSSEIDRVVSDTRYRERLCKQYQL